ncbi:MAG: GTP-binding protein [Candidatus Lokiarchaeota archaeon]|nr:GTP-binding protein [Candidatus Lokiarchaeota archaeon]
MLRQVFIFRGDELLYYRHFGKALKQEALDYLITEILNDISIKEEDTVEFHDYYKYRVSYITQKNLNLIFLFVTGLTDKFDNIKKELVKCSKEFTNLFEEILQHRFDAKTFEVFDPVVDGNHRNLRPKISLVGFSGVGKTTITRLIRAEEIPMQHIPTITGDIATVRIGKLHFHLWDFAGQEQFSYLWDNFIKGSDAVLLITDSSLENIEKSKFFLELIKEQAPHAHIAVIGNKQDLKGAENPAHIERILGLKSYSMIAKESNNRDKMIQIIADILEMSAEVSPLLKPLLERDKLIEEATKSLKSADFEKAAFLFDKISDLCIELGDDSLGKEFFEKSQKIKIMLKQVGAPQPTPAFPIESDKSEKPTALNQEVSEKISISKPSIPDETSEKYISPPPKLPPSKATQTKNLEQKSPEVPLIKQENSRQWIKSSKGLPEQKKEKEFNTETEKVGLKLNPEDYMVKIRPKTLGSVPKDAKSKLKTSAYGHVSNVPKEKETPDIAQTKKTIQMNISENTSKVKPPTRPSELFNTSPQLPAQQPLESVKVDKPVEIHKPPILEESTQIPIEDDKLSPTIDIQQSEHAKKTLIELKLKKADLYKMTLDFDMKELTGEISAEELAEKKKKINVYEEKIENQIQELEKLLGK